VSPADRPLVAVDVPQVGDDRRKNWAKVVSGVDDRLSSGWAFEGEFVSTGGIQDVPIGSVLLVYGERGSRMNPQVEARVYTVNGDGTLSHERSARGRAWARTLRDVVVDLLSAEASRPETARPWHPDLMGYSEDALREELRRRDQASPTDRVPRSQ
jgi:hypothetical protein